MAKDVLPKPDNVGCTEMAKKNDVLCVWDL